MNKLDLIHGIASITGHTKTDIAAILDAHAGLTIAELDRGNEHILPGLGKLVPVHRVARKGRNPKTGEAITIPARVVVQFKAGKALKEGIQ